jgi:hypothetical protein
LPTAIIPFSLSSATQTTTSFSTSTIASPIVSTASIASPTVFAASIASAAIFPSAITSSPGSSVTAPVSFAPTFFASAARFASAALHASTAQVPITILTATWTATRTITTFTAPALLSLLVALKENL